MDQTSRHGLMWLLNPSSSEAITPSVEEALHALGIHKRKFSGAQLPFILSDATAGSESELQAAVVGHADDVDLALQIRHSGFFANVIRHAQNDETSQRPVTAIEKFLDSNDEGLWENSWVRVPLRNLNKFARNVLTEDMRAKRSDAASGPRGDMQRFLVRHASGREFARGAGQLSDEAVLGAVSWRAGAHADGDLSHRAPVDGFLYQRQLLARDAVVQRRVTGGVQRRRPRAGA